MITIHESRRKTLKVNETKERKENLCDSFSVELQDRQIFMQALPNFNSSNRLGTKKTKIIQIFKNQKSNIRHFRNFQNFPKIKKALSYISTRNTYAKFRFDPLRNKGKKDPGVHGGRTGTQNFILCRTI